MNKFLAMPFLIIAIPSLACIALDTPIKLTGSTFEGETFLFSSDGDFIFDGDKVTYNLQTKKWCILEHGDRTKPSCLTPGHEIKLTKNGKTIGIGRVIPQDSTSLLIMSVDRIGGIDSSKPYLRIKNNSKIERGSQGPTVRPIVNVEAYENSKVVGTAEISGSEFYVDRDGNLLSMYRSLKITEPELPKTFEIKGNEISSGTCGKAPQAKALAQTSKPASLIVGAGAGAEAKR